jgi:hypothetical protein
MPIIEKPIDEIGEQVDGRTGEPSFVDREAVEFVVARVAEDVDNA